MTNDIDLDQELNVAEGDFDIGRMGIDQLNQIRKLIALVRSERARAEKAEQGSAYWNRRFAEEHARALAAEPFMRAFDGVSAEYASKGASTVGYPQIIKALDRLAAHLRAQDEPKREPRETQTCRPCNGEPIAPWPPVPGGGPTHHTCHPGEERKREPGGSSR